MEPTTVAVALGFAQFIPSIAKWLAGDRATLTPIVKTN